VASEAAERHTASTMSDLFGRLNISSFDAAAYVNETANKLFNLPNFDIAASDGVSRTTLNGAGVVAALDSRTENTTGPGQLRVLLQSATYFLGLSGDS